MSAISRNNGFTLLEVLIAVVLLGILTAALYGSYFTVMRARDRATSGMESRRELSATLDMIRREVSSSVPLNSASQQLKSRFIVEDRDNFGKPASTLTLTTLAPPSGYSRSESGVVVVTYQMVDKKGSRILTRQERDIFSEESSTPLYPQMEHIGAFLVECSNDGSTWLKSWNSAINGKRPGFVRVTVQVEEEGKTVEYSVLATPRVMGP